MLQKPEKEKKLEVKIGIGYRGKENRYYSGPSQRLKEKFVYIGTGRDSLYQFSLKAEEELSFSQSKSTTSAETGTPGSRAASGITFPMRPICFAVSISLNV